MHCYEQIAPLTEKMLLLARSKQWAALPALEAQYSAINCEMVAHGMGITLAHPLVARDYLHRDIVVRPFQPAIPLPTYVIWPHAQSRTRLAEDFIDTLKAHYRDLTKFL